METAGISIDSWKLKIFKKGLDDAGYKYTEGPGVTSDTLFLKVKFEASDINALAELVKELNSKAIMSKAN